MNNAHQHLADRDLITLRLLSRHPEGLEPGPMRRALSRKGVQCGTFSSPFDQLDRLVALEWVERRGVDRICSGLLVTDYAYHITPAGLAALKMEAGVTNE